MAYLTLFCRKLTVNVPNLMNAGGGWMAMGGFATLSQLSQNFLVFVVAFLLPFLGVKSLGPDVSIIEFF